MEEAKKEEKQRTIVQTNKGVIDEAAVQKYKE
jgi:hypothetical protein